MRQFRNIGVSFLFLLVAGLARTAQAAEVLVRNASELREALISAQENGESDVIILAAGNYYFEAAIGGESQRWAAFAHGSTDSLTIMGEPGTTARDVVLDGGHRSFVLDIHGTGYWTGEATAEINIIGLTLQNGYGPYQAGGLSIETSDHDVTIRDCIIRDNFSEAGNGGGVYVRTMNNLVFENNIVINNQLTERMVRNSADGPLHPVCLGAGAYLQASGPSKILRNNTFASNSAVEHTSCSGGGFWLEGGCFHTIDIINNTIYANRAAGATGGMFADAVFGTVNLYNNIIYGNTSGGIARDLVIRRSPGSTVRAYNNDFASRLASFTESRGNVNVDPRLTADSLGGLRLSADSSLIDSGTAAVVSVGMPSTDYHGDRRPCGSAPDIGADEFCGELPAVPPSISRKSKKLPQPALGKNSQGTPLAAAPKKAKKK